MRLSSLSAVTLGALLFSACPTPIEVPDSGNDKFDAGNPPDRAGCSGGCAANQICDTATRTCRDGCGGCDAGTCVKVADGVFECVENSVTCNGNQCAPGQVACLGGSCACLSSLVGGSDTCAVADQWCVNKNCTNPGLLQQCNPENTEARCGTGAGCADLFRNTAVCMKDCTNQNQCDRGDICNGAIAQGGIGCAPIGLFGDGTCDQHIRVLDEDGGWTGEYERNDAGALKLTTVPASNTCLVRALQGSSFVITDPNGLGTGTCQHAVFKTWNYGNILFSTCRPPGTANEGEACMTDFGQGTVATQCNTGLVCVPTRGVTADGGAEEGICQRACNAQPPGYGQEQKPGCNANESCVNFMRLNDPDGTAVLGACMKSCDVFSADAGTCADVGSSPASCVPTPATGELVVSLDGKGVCMPRRATVAAVGEACGETDPFHGAACGNAQLCSNGGDINASAVCTELCDTSCYLADGGVSADCATRPNALCAGGKSCMRVNSTTGARVGFCK